MRPELFGSEAQLLIVKATLSPKDAIELPFPMPRTTHKTDASSWTLALKHFLSEKLFELKKPGDCAKLDKLLVDHAEMFRGTSVGAVTAQTLVQTLFAGLPS